MGRKRKPPDPLFTDGRFSFRDISSDDHDHGGWAGRGACGNACRPPPHMPWDDSGLHATKGCINKGCTSPLPPHMACESRPHLSRWPWWQRRRSNPWESASRSVGQNRGKTVCIAAAVAAVPSPIFGQLLLRPVCQRRPVTRGCREAAGAVRGEAIRSVGEVSLMTTT